MKDGEDLNHVNYDDAINWLERASVNNPFAIEDMSRNGSDRFGKYIEIILSDALSKHRLDKAIKRRFSV